MNCRFRVPALLLSSVLLTLPTACALSTPAPDRLQALMPADVVMLGEQHDAADHQRIHRDVVLALAARGQLAALALEMAPQGASTAGLARNADEAAVQAALRWDDKAWPWASYAPAVMAAVRAGVPALGANLPRERMREAMADMRFDGLLSGPALKAQQQRIRLGHCGMLPEDRIGPMTRIQVARDVAMAQTLSGALQPGKVVVLLAGGGHVDKTLGVPQHLAPRISIKAVRLDASPVGTPAEASAGAFDAVWPTAPAPHRDYCAALRPAA